MRRLGQAELKSTSISTAPLNVCHRLLFKIKYKQMAGEEYNGLHFLHVTSSNALL